MVSPAGVFELTFPQITSFRVKGRLFYCLPDYFFDREVSLVFTRSVFCDEKPEGAQILQGKGRCSGLLADFEESSGLVFWLGLGKTHRTHLLIMVGSWALAAGNRNNEHFLVPLSIGIAVSTIVPK